MTYLLECAACIAILNDLLLLRSISWLVLVEAFRTRLCIRYGCTVRLGMMQRKWALLVLYVLAQHAFLIWLGRLWLAIGLWKCNEHPLVLARLIDYVRM